MKQKMTLAVIALALASASFPGLAAARCAYEDAKITASACGEGQVWDDGAQTCVEKPTS